MSGESAKANLKNPLTIVLGGLLVIIIYCLLTLVIQHSNTSPMVKQMQGITNKCFEYSGGDKPQTLTTKE